MIRYKLTKQKSIQMNIDLKIENAILITSFLLNTVLPSIQPVNKKSIVCDVLVHFRQTMYFKRKPKMFSFELQGLVCILA